MSEGEHHIVYTEDETDIDRMIVAANGDVEEFRRLYRQRFSFFPYLCGPQSDTVDLTNIEAARNRLGLSDEDTNPRFMVDKEYPPKIIERPRPIPFNVLYHKEEE